MLSLCGFREYSYPHRRLFGLNPYPPSISSLASSFPLKMLAFYTPSLLPLRISNDLPWGGYGYNVYFLELHINIMINNNNYYYWYTSSALEFLSRLSSVIIWVMVVRERIVVSTTWRLDSEETAEMTSAWVVETSVTNNFLTTLTQTRQWYHTKLLMSCKP